MVFNQNSEYLPLPKDGGTYVVSEEKTAEREKRVHREKEEWIAEMHKADENTNWREIERDNRKSGYTKRQKSFKTSSDGNESLANGHLYGYWTERGSKNQAGRILVATYDPVQKLIYAGSQGGTVYRGTLQGQNWTPLNDKLKIENIRSIEYTSAPDNKLIVAGSKEIYWTDDDGENWTLSTGLQNVLSWGSIRKMKRVNDANSTLYALIQEWDYTNWNAEISIYKSVDNGESFQLVYSIPDSQSGPIGMQDIWSSIDGDSNLYILQNNEVKVLSPSNSTPTVRGTIPMINLNSGLLYGNTNQSNSILYVYADNLIFVSTNGGLDWRLMGTHSENPFGRNSFAASSNDPSILYIGGVDTYVSNDTGTTWNIVNNWYDYYGNESDNLHADVPGIFPFYDENGDENQFICTDGGLYTSSNNIQTVTNISLNGLNVSQYYSVYTNKNDPRYIYTGSQDQGLQRAFSVQKNILDFDQAISGDYGHLVSGNNGSSLWFLYPGFVAFNSDATSGTWDAKLDFNGINDYWLPPMIADPNNPGQAYLAGKDPSDNPRIYKLNYSNGIITSQMLSFDFSTLGTGKISAMAISPINPSHWYALTGDGEFYYSSTSGSTWNKRTIHNGPEAHYFYGASIYASETELGKVYIAGSGYSNPGAWATYDHGQNFHEITNGLPKTLVYQLAADESDSLIYAASEAGPYVFSEKDSMWYNISGTDAPDQVYWSVEFVDVLNVVRYGTFGRGIWDFNHVDTTSIDTNQSNVPEILKSNTIALYPNPTTDYLTVQIENTNRGIDRIEIYSLTGQLMIDNSYEMKHLIQLNVSNLSSGTYLVNVVQGNERSISRFVKN